VKLAFSIIRLVPGSDADIIEVSGGVKSAESALAEFKGGTTSTRIIARVCNIQVIDLELVMEDLKWRFIKGP
jgi:hypothetical protein